MTTTNKKDTFKLVGDTVIMQPHPYLINIDFLLSKKIIQNLGLKVIFLAKTKKDKEFYENNFQGFFSKVIYNSNDIDSSNYKNIKVIDNIEKKAVEIENKYKSSLNRIFITHRVIGRGFSASGGCGHPRNRTHVSSTNEMLINMCVNELVFWENLFKEEKVCLAINLYPYAHKIAIHNKIKSLRLISGKFGNTFTWSSLKGYYPEIKKKDLTKTKNNSLRKINLKSPYDSYIIARNKDIRSLSYYEVIKKFLTQLIKITYGKIKGYQKIKNTFIFDELKLILNYRFGYNNYMKYVKHGINDLKNKSFIFFPLQCEPELAMLWQADDFFFQLTALNVLSRDLPSDYIIVIKENLAALGRRPRDFYRQIADLKNVVFVGTETHGLEYIKSCKAVATVTGSAGLEAAVMGIPVLSFSKNNIYNILDHVLEINDLSNLRNIFFKIKKNKYPNIKSIRDGSKFFYAYRNKFFEMPNFDPTGKKVVVKNNAQSSVHERYADILYHNLFDQYDVKKSK